MMEFRARWLAAFGAAKEALSLALGLPSDAISPYGARIPFRADASVGRDVASEATTSKRHKKKSTLLDL